MAGTADHHVSNPERWVVDGDRWSRRRERGCGGIRTARAGRGGGAETGATDGVDGGAGAEGNGAMQLAGGETAGAAAAATTPGGRTGKKWRKGKKRGPRPTAVARAGR